MASLSCHLVLLHYIYLTTLDTFKRSQWVHIIVWTHIDFFALYLYMDLIAYPKLGVRECNKVFKKDQPK